MTEEPTDWRVAVVLDEGPPIEDIDKLVRILARQRMIITVSASSREEAEEKARAHAQRYAGIPSVYVKALHPRKLPT